MDHIADWLREATSVMADIPVDQIAAVARLLHEAYDANRTIYVMGNGGSASTASHLALDFQKATRTAGARPVRAVSLSDNVGMITAWGNDTSFDQVFAEQVRNLARAGDVVMVISASGNSPNVIAALTAARETKARTAGLFGCGGGKAAALCDAAIIVPSNDYGWIESAHLTLEHVLTYSLRDHIVGAAERTGHTGEGTRKFR